MQINWFNNRCSILQRNGSKYRPCNPSTVLDCSYILTVLFESRIMLDCYNSFHFSFIKSSSINWRFDWINSLCLSTIYRRFFKLTCLTANNMNLNMNFKVICCWRIKQFLPLNKRWRNKKKDMIRKKANSLQNFLAPCDVLAFSSCP